MSLSLFISAHPSSLSLSFTDTHNLFLYLSLSLTLSFLSFSYHTPPQIHFLSTSFNPFISSYILSRHSYSCHIISFYVFLLLNLPQFIVILQFTTPVVPIRCPLILIYSITYTNVLPFKHIKTVLCSETQVLLVDCAQVHAEVHDAALNHDTRRRP